MHGSRADKVAGAIQEEVSNILQKEIKDPRVGFVTIMRVEVADDLRFAKIYFSKIGSPEEKKKAFAGLKKATGFIRKNLAQRINLRYAPEIVFKLDESAEYSQHIEELLKKIKEEKTEKKDADK